MEEEVVKTDFVNITYNIEHKIIKVVWTGKNTSEEYRDIIMKSLNWSKDHQVDYYLSDIRNQKVISPEDRTWFQKEIIPKAIEAGLKKAVVIFDGNVFKKYYLNTILKTTNVMKLPFKFVKNEEEAMEFLLK